MILAKILIVEDDKNISKLVKYNLDKDGYDCMTSITGEEALDILEKESIDLIVLDLMLPKMDGFEVCRRIRQDEKHKDIPVIMLTAKGQEVDRIVGLELGADDYMVKPFSPRELSLRIKAILKRGKIREIKKDVLRAGLLCVDIPKHEVTIDGKKIVLTLMEFKLLALLMQRAGRVQTRDALLLDVWGMEAEIYTRTVDTHIKRLREKLGKAGKLIETVVGLGYKFRSDDEN